MVDLGDGFCFDGVGINCCGVPERKLVRANGWRCRRCWANFVGEREFLGEVLRCCRTSKELGAGDGADGGFGLGSEKGDWLGLMMC